MENQMRKRTSTSDGGPDLEDPVSDGTQAVDESLSRAPSNNQATKSAGLQATLSKHKSHPIDPQSVPNDDDDDDKKGTDESEFGNMWLGNYEKKKCNVLSFFPPITWLPAYIRTVRGRPSLADTDLAGGLPYSVQGDLIAGLTVGVMLVPQCLAFAMLADLPVQVGLYASFMPLIAYAAFGTIRQVQPGPTALMSLLCGQALDSSGMDSDASRIAGAAMLALMVGLISVFLGAVRFGFIVDFMSHTVMAAFCSAAGVTIATSQLKHLFGIKMKREKHWWQTAGHLITHLHEIDIPTFALGGTILFFLLLLKYWKSAGSEDARSKHMIWRFFPKKKTGRSFKILKMVADLGSLMAVVFGWLWGWIYRMKDVTTVKFVGHVDSDGFALALPGKDGFDTMDTLIVSALVMAVVGFLETMAVGGKFAMQARYEYEPNQELLALGLSNLASGLMSGYPVTGSFSRTAVNAMLGASSLVACALSSLLVLLAVYILLPVIAQLPLAALAPIIIQGAIGVINLHDFVVAFKATKTEFMVMFATFTVCLALTVKEGLLVGFVFSILKTMHDLANPNLAVCGKLADSSFRDIRNFPNAQVLPTAVVVRMDARLSFANSRKMKEFAIRAVQVRESQGDSIQYVVIDGKSMNHVDLTGCEMLEMLAESLKSRNQSLIVANIKGPTTKCLAAAGVPVVLKKHGGHLCIDMDQALAIIRGEDKEGFKSQQAVNELVKQVDTAKHLINKANSTKFYACQAACTTPLIKPSESGLGSSKLASTTPNSTPAISEYTDEPVDEIMASADEDNIATTSRPLGGTETGS